ncbi:MAG: thioredoxin [Gammaproteobacteria bacterium]
MNESAFVFNATQADFQERVIAASAQTPVLVDFWADWCAPCHALMPVLDKLVDEYQGKFVLAKVNADQEQALAATLGIRSLPTVVLFKDGQVADHFTGAQPESAVREILDRHIEAPEASPADQAARLLADGDAAGALPLLEQASAVDPADVDVKITLARALLLTGNAARAAEILDELPAHVRERPEVAGLLGHMEFSRIAGEEPDRAKLEQRLSDNPGDLHTLYTLSAHSIINSEYETGMDQLLAIVQKDRNFRDGAARKGLLAVFEILGGKGELVSRYRSKLLSALH